MTDYQTSTVSGSAAFESGRTSNEYFDEQADRRALARELDADDEQIICYRCGEVLYPDDVLYYMGEPLCECCYDEIGGRR